MLAFSNDGRGANNQDCDLPDIDSLVPLSQGLFPPSVAQAFGLPSLGGLFQPSAPAPQPPVRPNQQQRDPQAQWTAFAGQPSQPQPVPHPAMLQPHGCPQPGGSPKGTQSSVSRAGPNYPMYVPYPPGAPPPYASALPSVFGNGGFGHLHGTMGYPSFSLSEGAPTSSGPGQHGVRMGSGPTPSMTETTDEDFGDGTARAIKRARLVWTPQLHKRFEEAVAKLGPEKSIPKNIMQEMNVEGLTRENVASHLQKYRLQKKEPQQPEHQSPGSQRVQQGQSPGDDQEQGMRSSADGQPHA